MTFLIVLLIEIDVLNLDTRIRAPFYPAVRLGGDFLVDDIDLTEALCLLPLCYGT